MYQTFLASFLLNIFFAIYHLSTHTHLIVQIKIEYRSREITIQFLCVFSVFDHHVDGINVKYVMYVYWKYREKENANEEEEAR